MDHPAEPAPLERGRVRLLFLDGLRGFSALYVVLFHAHWQVYWHFHPVPLAGAAAWINHLLDYGHDAVAVFIVLSGYCLMIPVARSGGFSIPGGVGRYLVRRGRRILPPYYAALGLSLFLIACVPAMSQPGGERWTTALPAFTPGVLLSHLCLWHCFSPDWTSKIDPPMWSVGVEWWIYFLFPAVLLPLWRRVGLYGTLALVTVLSVGPHWLPGHPLDFICPWYFALFAFGAAAAFLNFSAAGRERAGRWDRVAAGGLALYLLLRNCTHGWVSARPFMTDVMLGAVVAAFVVSCGEKAAGKSPSFVVANVLESRLALWLGNISYSLYLVHDPVIALISPAIRATGWSAEARFYTHLWTGLLASLAVAYVFHRLFERPFMVGHPKSSAKVAISAAIEPAP